MMIVDLNDDKDFLSQIHQILHKKQSIENLQTRLLDSISELCKIVPHDINLEQWEAYSSILMLFFGKLLKQGLLPSIEIVNLIAEALISVSPLHTHRNAINLRKYQTLKLLQTLADKYYDHPIISGLFTACCKSTLVFDWRSGPLQVLSVIYRLLSYSRAKKTTIIKPSALHAHFNQYYGSQFSIHETQTITSLERLLLPPYWDEHHGDPVVLDGTPAARLSPLDRMSDLSDMLSFDPQKFQGLVIEALEVLALSGRRLETLAWTVKLLPIGWPKRKRTTHQATPRQNFQLEALSEGVRNHKYRLNLAVVGGVACLITDAFEEFSIFVTTLDQLGSSSAWQSVGFIKHALFEAFYAELLNYLKSKREVADYAGGLLVCPEELIARLNHWKRNLTDSAAAAAAAAASCIMRNIIL